MKLHRIYALLLKYYYISITSLDRLADIFYWPILDVFIWGFMTIYIQKLSDYNLTSFVFGGIILWLFVWRSSQDLAVFILEDYWSKNLYNLFTSPLQLKELVVAIMLCGFGRTIISFLFMITVAFLLYKFVIFGVGILALGIFASILLIFSWCLGLCVAALIVRFGSRIQVLAWSIVWLVQPFSCVFYPLEALPDWGKRIAIFLPSTHVFESMRAVIRGTAVNIPSLLFSFVMALLLFVLSSLFFYYNFRKAKMLGYLAKVQ